MDVLAVLVEGAVFLGEGILLAGSLMYRRRVHSSIATWLAIGAAGQFVVFGLVRTLGIAVTPALVEALGGETASAISLTIAAVGSAFALLFAISLFRILAAPQSSASA